MIECFETHWESKPLQTQFFYLLQNSCFQSESNGDPIRTYQKREDLPELYQKPWGRVQISSLLLRIWPPKKKKWHRVDATLLSSWDGNSKKYAVLIFTHFHQPINGRSMLVRSPPTEFPCPTSAPLSSTTSPGLNVLPTGEKAFRAPTVGRVLKAIIVIVVPKSKKSDQSVEGKINSKNNINRKIQNNSVIARKCAG